MATDLTPAREAWNRGATLEEAAKLVGVTGQYLGRVQRAQAWTRPSATVTDRLTQREIAAREAGAESQRKWANRRSQEADAAGIVAARARQGIVEAIEDRNDKMTKAAAVAYGILIDKAQLLSGAATQRFGSEDPRERAERILDELGARRAEREQRAS
jgi:hypothetical protein